MRSIPRPIFHEKLPKINWQRIYLREYGVQYSEMMLSCTSSFAGFIVPMPCNDHIIIPEKKNTALYSHKISWDRMEKSLFEKYAKRMSFFYKYERNFLKAGKEYLRFTVRIKRLNLKKKSNREFLDLYQQYQKRLLNYTVYLGTAFVINNYVASRASEIVEGYLKEGTTGMRKDQVLTALLAPYKKAAPLKFEHYINKYAGKMTTKRLQELYRRYYWLPCQDIHNKSWTKQQFKRNVLSLPKKRVKKTKTFSHYIKLLKINAKDKKFFDIARRLAYIKDLRDEFRRKGICNMLSFFGYVACRMGVKTGDVSYLTSQEVVDFLKNEIVPSVDKVRARKKGFVMYFDSKKNIVCLEKEKVDKVLIKFKLKFKEILISNIKGIVASKGRVVGKVVIVKGVSDLYKVKKGAILIAVATHPDYTIAMGKSAAIVTEEGGITSHAAIVSREFGIPCIVGASSATEVFKTGDDVLVDAINGFIKKTT